MIRASLLPLSATLIICGFCGKEFMSLGRHSWRCKSKVGNEQDSTINTMHDMVIPAEQCLPVKSCKVVKCCCGKVCKGARGLKMHQRSCRVIDNLEDELQQQMAEACDDHSDGENVDQAISPENLSINCQENFPDLKKGIKLPKSPLQWSIANNFFKLTFSNHPITPHDLNNNIGTMATVIYNSLAKILVLSMTIIAMLNLKVNIKHFQLKLENGNVTEIKFVAKKLRNVLNKSKITAEHNLLLLLRFSNNKNCLQES